MKKIQNRTGFRGRLVALPKKGQGLTLAKLLAAKRFLDANEVPTTGRLLFKDGKLYDGRKLPGTKRVYLTIAQIAEADKIHAANRRAARAAIPSQ